jgi:Na+-driven multidrug efflux pump
MNTKTPAIAVLVASIVNIIGDLLLSPKLGIQGAAIATAVASLSSCLILLNRVRKVTNEWKQNQEAEEKESSSLATSSSTEASSDDIPFWSLPDKKSLKDLLLLAGPIFFVMIGKVGCYSALTLRATGLGIVNLATHNIMMRIFFFFSCFGDSLGNAAQSFFPQVAKIDRKKLIQRLLAASTIVGLANCLSSSLILTRFNGFLTKDVAMSQLMRQFASYVCVTELMHPFVMLMEGLVLAKRDLKFLVALYFSTSIAHLGFVFSKWGASFGGLWQALLCFQSLRFGQFAIRAIQQSRKGKGSMATV